MNGQYMHLFSRLEIGFFSLKLGKLICELGKTMCEHYETDEDESHFADLYREGKTEGIGLCHPLTDAVERLLNHPDIYAVDGCTSYYTVTQTKEVLVGGAQHSWLQTSLFRGKREGFVIIDLCPVDARSLPMVVSPESALFHQYTQFGLHPHIHSIRTNPHYPEIVNALYKDLLETTAGKALQEITHAPLPK